MGRRQPITREREALHMNQRLEKGLEPETTGQK